MKQTDNPLKKRKHADWQNPYRRSSNFPTLVEDETDNLKIKGNGKLKVKASKEEKEDKEQ